MSHSPLISSGSLIPSPVLTARQAVREPVRPSGVATISKLSEDLIVAAPALSGLAEVSTVEDAPIPTSWLVWLNVSLSMSATAALIWVVGLTPILGLVLTFWTALGALGLVLWWREMWGAKRSDDVSLQEPRAENARAAA
jgi:hypothetical protein